MSVINILLVDDELDFRSTLQKRLAKRDLNVEGVGSGEEALETLNTGSYDVIILDVKMKGMDGIQVLREIKKSYPLIEVIMLTGHAEIEVAMQGMELGAFDYLMKPMDIDDLLYKIQDAHKKKSIQEQKIKQIKKIKDIKN
jgi:DNA-binding NtrC family response regulator